MVPFYPLQTALLNIVLRDSFAAPEKDIFLALLNWCKHNAKENHAEIMQAVRLPLMSLTELLNVVRPSGLLSPDAILDAIKVRSESRDMDLNYRGMLSKYLPPSPGTLLSYTSSSCRAAVQVCKAYAGHEQRALLPVGVVLCPLSQHGELPWTQHSSFWSLWTHSSLCPSDCS